MKIRTSWDDATVQDLEVAELLIKHGLENSSIFYFPVMPSVVNEPKGRTSLNNKQQQGVAEMFEIGGHTITHPLLTRIPVEQAKTEIVDSRKMLQDKFGQDINSFAYPRGYANAELQMIVKEAGYSNARSTLVGYLDKSENPYFEQTTIHAGCDRKEYGGVSWFAYSIAMLKKATPDSIFHIWGHGFELSAYPNGMKLFDQLLGLLK